MVSCEPQAAGVVTAETELQFLTGAAPSGSGNNAARRDAGGLSESTEHGAPSSAEVRPPASVAGLDDALGQLCSMLELPFARAAALAHLHVECPRGLLLHGPPGCGKTSLVRAAAQRTGATLVSVRRSLVPRGRSSVARFGSLFLFCLFLLLAPATHPFPPRSPPSLLQASAHDLAGPFFGDSEAKLRKLFARTKRMAARGPCVLFLDELDALCPKREGGNSQSSRLVAQLLTLMDGIEARGQVRLGRCTATTRMRETLGGPRRPQAPLTLSARPVQPDLMPL